MHNKKGFAPIVVLLIIAAVLVVGGIWYHQAYQPTPAVNSPIVTSPSTSSLSIPVTSSNTPEPATSNQPTSSDYMSGFNPPPPSIMTCRASATSTQETCHSEQYGFDFHYPTKLGRLQFYDNKDNIGTDGSYFLGECATVEDAADAKFATAVGINLNVLRYRDNIILNSYGTSTFSLKEIKDGIVRKDSHFYLAVILGTPQDQISNSVDESSNLRFINVGPYNAYQYEVQYAGPCGDGTTHLESGFFTSKYYVTLSLDEGALGQLVSSTDALAADILSSMKFY